MTRGLKGHLGPLWAVRASRTQLTEGLLDDSEHTGDSGDAPMLVNHQRRSFPVELP